MTTDERTRTAHAGGFAALLALLVGALGSAGCATGTAPSDYYVAGAVKSGCGPGESKRAKPVVAVQPSYPRAAAMRKQEGWVTIEFKVRPDGSVAETAVVAAEPEGVFDRTALRAIDKWRFDPACADGYPTESAERYTLRFRLGQ